MYLIWLLLLSLNPMSVGVALGDANEASIIDCADGPSGIENLVEPLSDSTRTYGNGRIRILHLDTGGEPACCSSYLAVLAPDPLDELFGRQCKLLASDSNGSGFMSVDIGGVGSRYDGAKGLLLTVPVKYHHAGSSLSEGSETAFEYLGLRINQSSGEMTLETPDIP